MDRIEQELRELLAEQECGWRMPGDAERITKLRRELADSRHQALPVERRPVEPLTQPRAA